MNRESLPLLFLISGKLHGANFFQILCNLNLLKSASFYKCLDSIALYNNSDADVPGKHLYVFLFDEDTVTVPCRPAVTTASDALLIC